MGAIQMNVMFEEGDGDLVGVDDHGRSWRVVQTIAGWRLEFRDAGDTAATYAGTHRSMDSAMHEAG